MGDPKARGLGRTTGLLQQDATVSVSPRPSFGLRNVLARLTFGEFTSMAGRLSMFNVLEMLQAVNLTLQSNQTVSADHLTERELVAMGEEAIMAEHIVSFERLSLVEHSPTPANITQAEVSEMMHKLQRYQERFGPLDYGDPVKAEVASSE